MLLRECFLVECLFRLDIAGRFVGSSARGPRQSLCVCPMGAPSGKGRPTPRGFSPRGVLFFRRGVNPPPSSENAPGAFSRDIAAYVRSM